MLDRVLFWLIAVALPAGAIAQTPTTLRVLVETSTDMPMTRIVNGQLVGGLHRDIGLALANQMGRRVEFVLLPRKRMAAALENGAGDVACHFRPSWLPGDFDWSTPFLPNALLLIGDRSAPPLDSVTALANVPIGTVEGFSYPDIEAALGPAFRRDDSPTQQTNLRKLAAHRLHYVLLGQAFYRYQQQKGGSDLPAQAQILEWPYLAQCAVSRRGHVGVAEVDRAIEGIKKLGVIPAAFASYR